MQISFENGNIHTRRQTKKPIYVQTAQKAQWSNDCVCFAQHNGHIMNMEPELLCLCLTKCVVGQENVLLLYLFQIMNISFSAFSLFYVCAFLRLNFSATTHTNCYTDTHEKERERERVCVRESENERRKGTENGRVFISMPPSSVCQINAIFSYAKQIIWILLSKSSVCMEYTLHAILGLTSKMF